MKKISVAIDNSPLKSGHSIRGVGSYVKELIDELLEESNKDGSFSIFPVNLKEEKNKDKFDLVHYTFFNPYFVTLPFKKDTKTIVTIHDLIPLIYKEHYPPGLQGSIKFFIQKMLLKNVDAFITVSETSKKDIVRLLNIPEDKIKVIYNGVKKIFHPIKDKAYLAKVIKKYSLPKEFVLFVGDVNYNKNLLNLAEAINKSSLNFVIVGKQAGRTSIDKSNTENLPFAELLERFGNNPKILRLGFVEDLELPAIYNLATIYCQSSFYEGFGLPVLEAMSCGIPVACSKTQSLVEIAGEGALYFNPNDVREMTHTLEKLSQNTEIRSRLIRKGFEISTKFSWERSAKETLHFYKEVVMK